MNVVMIMCHKNVPQVIRFAKRCHTEKTDVVIHCDIQMDAKEYQEMEQFCASERGYYLVNERIHGVLDSRSLVDIAMNMVKRAKEAERTENKHYAYYMLCSGQDYLIPKMETVEAQLLQAYPTPFLDCTSCDTTEWVRNKFQSHPSMIPFVLWINRRFRKKSLLRKVFRTCERIANQVACALFGSCGEKLSKRTVALYGGSAWWALPDCLMDFILQEYEDPKNEIVHLILDGSYTPEETFFQIMAKRSPFADTVAIDALKERSKTWSYFYDEDKPAQPHPYTFTAAEFEKLKQRGCWFARKFDMAVDETILDLIDHEQ